MSHPFNHFKLLPLTKLCLVYSCSFKQVLDNQNTYTLPPIIPAEVLNFLQFQQIWILLLQTALPLPRQHPYTAPFVPKELHAWVTEYRLRTLAAQAQKKIMSVLSWQYGNIKQHCFQNVCSLWITYGSAHVNKAQMILTFASPCIIIQFK